MFDADGARVRIPVAHRAPVWAVATHPFSPESSLVVSAGADHTLRGWDAATGQATGFASHAGDGVVKYVGLAVAGNSALVISADSQAVRRFDLVSNRQVGEPLRPPRRERLVAVATLAADESPTIVAVGSSGRAHLWNGLTGESIGSGFAIPGGEVLTIVPAHHTGVIVVSTAEGHVRLWDVARGVAIGPPLTGHRRPVTALACLTDGYGRAVVIGQEFQGSIHRWDADTAATLGPALPQSGRGPHRGSLAVTPDGAILMSVDAGGAARRWDLSRPQPVAEPLSHEAPLTTATAVAVTSSGPMFITGSENGQLRRWDRAGQLIGPDLTGHPGIVSDVLPVAATPYATLASVLVSRSGNGALCWDAESGTNIGSPPFAPVVVVHRMAAAWLPSGQLVVASAGDDGLARTEVFSGRYHPEDLDEADEGYVPGDSTVWGVAAGMLPDGRPFFAAACASGSVRLLDAATGRPVRPPLLGLDDSAVGVAIAGFDDGIVMVAAGGDEGQVLRWNAITGEQIGQPLTAGASVLAVAFRVLPDGHTVLIVIDDDAWVYRWDARSGEPIGDPLQAPGETGILPRLAPAAPGPLIAVARGDVTRVWHAGTGKMLADIAGATSATTLTLPNGEAALAVGHTDGSLTVTTLADS